MRLTVGSRRALLIVFPVITKAAANVRQRKEAILTQSPVRALMFSFGVWGPGSWSSQGDRNYYWWQVGLTLMWLQARFFFFFYSTHNDAAQLLFNKKRKENVIIYSP